MITVRPTPWTEVLLLCGKCARKMQGGYGDKGRERLRSALRAALKASGRRREVRIVETRCLGVCPKKAVAAMRAGRPGRLLTIPKGARAEEALSRLLETAPPKPAGSSAANAVVKVGSEGLDGGPDPV